jgi:tRNA(Arg) A34 adenosine deaminase TadA
MPTSGRAGVRFADDARADVAAPWRAALELAWAAYAAGTIPVGAVVVDASGRIVAEGENVVYRADADVPLDGSCLAHADVAALGQLGSESATKT